MRITYIYIVIGAFFFSLNASAQDTGVGEERLEIVKNFKAVLGESKKKDLPAKIPTEQKSSEPQNYNLESRLLKVSYDPPKIRPLAFSTKKQQKGHKFYAKLGGGFPTSVFGDVSYYDYKDNWMYGGRITHHSLNNDAAVENQVVGNTGVEVLGKHYFSDFVAGAMLTYDLDKYRFFALEEGEVPVEDSIQQTFNRIGGQFFFENIKDNPIDLDYRIDADLYNLTDDFDASEFGADINVNAQRPFRNHKAELNIGLRSQSLDFNGSEGVTNVYANPSFTFNTEVLSARVGFEFNAGDGESFLTPDIELNVPLADKKAVLFAKWFEDSPFLSLDYIKDINPFVGLVDADLPFFYKEKRQLGIKGGIQKVQYEFSAYQARLENQLLFVNSTIDSRRFQPVFDDGSMINVHLGGTVTPSSQSKVFLNLDFNNYDLDNVEEAFHLPTLEANLGGQLRVTEKVTASAETYFGSGIDYLTQNGEVETLNTLFDVNLGGQYEITDKFSGFLNINNILNNERERFNNYPSVGLNFLAGIILKY